MAYADLSALERDRRLNRIDDLFTVDFLTRYVLWKLGGDANDQSDARATAAHQLPQDGSVALVPARAES
jgi:hypothetical protein